MEPPPTTGLLYFSITDADESTIPAAPGSKRRRLRGACNHCRQRKIRCDSATKPGNICSNCIAFNSQCTHNGLGYSKKGSPDLDSSRSPSGSTSMPFPDSDAYNEKTAPEHVDTILIQSTAYIAARDLRNILLDVARYARELEQELEKYKSQFVSSRGSSTALESTPSPAANADFSDDNSQTVVDSSPDGIMVLCDDFQDMNIVNATRSVFFGRSSGFYLIQTAQELRAEHDGPDVQQPKPTRREEFWHSPWEITPLPPAPAYKFPPQDLLGDLISIFFDRVNIILSCLHRPTFERSVASGLHLIDHSFGSLVLALCSLASRYSDDPRVVLEGTNSKLSSGWEWFRQIQHTGGEFHLRSLYDLQRIFISVVYLQGTCSPEACWTLVAVGVRKLQDLGVHMRKRHHGEQANMTFTTIIEEELYKRTFWMFLCSDALISSFLGRPRIARDDECLDSLCRAEIHGAKLFSSYDIDYPLEVDDEFWEHPDPNKRFQQPEGKPSIYAFIVSYLKLTEILGTTQKTIYSVKRAQRSPGWSQSAVAELDSALNQWLDSIPDHLRWDPNREDEPFATQSACLYTGYYHVQIQIHRSFIPSPMNDAPLSSTFPSLAICANSARSCSRVMEAQARRGLIANPQAVSALMDCAIVILLNVWGAGRTGISVDPQRAANDVKKCIGVLKMYEVHWQVAGRYCDLLFTIGNQLINNPPAASTTTRKRGRSSQVSEPVPSPSQDAVQDPRNIAGSRRVSAAIQQQEDATSTINLNHFYPLPISTEELGHLPVYQSFDWGVPFGNDTLAFEPSSFAFNAQEQQYNSDLEFKSIIDSGESMQYVQPNSFGGYDGVDWATRDWTTYVNSVDQLMRSLDSDE